MSWHVKATGGYGYATAEAFDNAVQIYDILYSLGWGLGAISGVLGNLQFESELNPWRWESDQILASDDPQIDYSTTHGYGLFQFTPSGKYAHAPEARSIPGFGPNYSDKAGSDFDGYAQLLFVDQYADYIATPTYPISYADFKLLTSNPRYCADVWLRNYERGTASHWREDYAEHWYNVLYYVTPGQPDIPGGLSIPVGAIAALQRKGGGIVANILKRRMAGHTETRSNWSRKRM